MRKRVRIGFFLATSGWSGVDRIAKNLLPALSRRGYLVDLIKVKGHGPFLPPELRDTVNVIELRASHTYSAFPGLVRYIYENRPSVLFSDKDRANRVALLARAISGRKTRLVLSSGTTISVDLVHRGPFERMLQRFSMGRLYALADKVIVTCEGVRRDMAAYTGLDIKKIEVVPPPVVPSWAFSQNLPFPDHPWFGPNKMPVVLGAGELSYRKDFETLIRAFSIVEKRRRLRLIILGKGKQKRHLKALSFGLGIEDKVSFPGFVQDPYPFMAHAALFALTSRWEGLGFVLIEALSLGTPAVSTDCPSGPQEVLDGGRYGPLVPVGDFEALAAAMERVLEDPLPACVLREAARPYEVEQATEAYIEAMGLDP